MNLADALNAAKNGRWTAAVQQTLITAGYLEYRAGYYVWTKPVGVKGTLSLVRTRKPVQQIRVPPPIGAESQGLPEDEEPTLRCSDTTKIVAADTLYPLLRSCEAPSDPKAAELVQVATTLAAQLQLACNVQLMKDAAGRTVVRRIVIEPQPAKEPTP